MLALRTALLSSRITTSLERNALRSLTIAIHTSRNDSSENIKCGRATTLLIPTGTQFTLLAGQQQSRWYAAKTKDDLSERNRVYYGPLASRMKAVKVFSLTTSLVGLAVQPMLLEQGMKMGGTGMAIFLCSFAGFFTFVTPFLLHFITKKYVTEIYYNSATHEYTAITLSFLLRKIQTKFRAGDVTVPDVPGMFTTFIVDKKPLFVEASQFDDPEHYVKMMGYDKPIDFKLDLKEHTTTTPQSQDKAAQSQQH